MPKTKKATPATEPKDDINVRCVVAATNAAGSPDFYACVVVTCESDVADGEHYVVASGMAEDAGFDGPMVVFDEADGPGWLFANMFDALDPAPAADGCEAEAAVPTAKPSVKVVGHGCWIGIGNSLFRVVDIKSVRVTDRSVLVETHAAEHNFEVGSDQLTKEAVFDAIAKTLISSE